MTIKEAAVELGISAQLCRMLCEQGTIGTVIRRGGRRHNTYIPLPDLVARVKEGGKYGVRSSADKAQP